MKSAISLWEFLERFFINNWCLIILLIAVSLIVYVLLKRKVQSFYDPKIKLSRHDIINIIIAVIGAIVICLQLLISHRQIKLIAEQLDQQRHINSANQFRDGIELLKSENDAVVVGSIILLDDLARNFPDNYAKSVFEVFCGFLRVDTKENWDKYILNNKSKYNTDSLLLANYYFPNKYQTLINRVFKDKNSFYRKSIGKDFLIDLNGVYLKNADLSKTDFKGADLENSSMQWSNLNDANLENAKLKFANLKEVTLFHAILVKSDLSGAQLQGSNFLCTNMQGSYLQGASLETSFFIETHLEGAFLATAHLEGAYLQDVHLEGANLWRTHLEGTILFDLYFQGATANFQMIEDSFLKAEDMSGGYSPIIFFQGGGEHAISHDVLMKYDAGHKLIILKTLVGKPSFIKKNKDGALYIGGRTKNEINAIRNRFEKEQVDTNVLKKSSLHFGELTEKRINEIHDYLEKIQVDTADQNNIIFFIRDRNKLEHNIREQLIKGGGILTREKAHIIIKRVNKELGNE